MAVATTPTRERILDTAEEMIQDRGYNAVSFRDLAETVDIKSASIHYYFQSKADLGKALVQRYAARFADIRSQIDGSAHTPEQKLRRYADELRDAFRASGKMCLGGILAAESSTLPRPVADQVRGFFRENEEWLASILDAGRKSGVFRFEGSPADAGRSLFATLEGALMSAWTFGEAKRLTSAANWAIAALTRT